MKLSSPSFEDGQRIPTPYAFCAPDPASHVCMSSNRNPAFAWEDAPENTRSFALLCVDPDVPSKPDDVNQEGREVPADLPRVDFYHWVLVDIPASAAGLGEGEFSDEVTARGKSGPDGPGTTRQGLNNYTDWFSGDADMAGDYFGYDGPCPPWNDSILHHYVFTLYALDVDRCPLDGVFRGEEVAAAIAPHVLASSSITGIYTLNPRVAA